MPENSGEVTKDQKQFLEQAVNGLAQDGKVVCVRLALFAEMMKGRPWTPAALKEVGGTEGIGLIFLEETFGATTAPPERRFHQKASRAVLKALLPESGTDIKGHMRSAAELFEASGYSGREQDFEDLIRILDGEIRLITPTDPEGSELADPSKTNVAFGEKYYQLTHDYLVHSLREWLARKQKETRAGRAELRLAEWTALWNAKPESRRLPSLWEYLHIRLLTDNTKWTQPQRLMMGQAGRAHGMRSGIVAAVLMAILLGVWEINGRFQAAALVKRLSAADITQVPGIVQELGGYRRWADPLLKQEDALAEKGSNKKLHLDLALLPVDPSKIAELREDLQRVSQGQFPVVRDALTSYRDNVTGPLWNVALDSGRDIQRRFQAAVRLATYAPEDKRWNQISAFVAGHLVTLDASALVAWRDALRPAKTKLIKPLASIYRNSTQKEKEQSRGFATETLADYAANQPEELFNLLADAEEFQFPAIFQALARHNAEAFRLAQQELTRKPAPTATEVEKELLAKRQANTAVVLLRLDHAEEVWPKLKTSPDPRLRSDLIHWFSPLGVDPQTMIQRLDIESDVTIRQALVLALGQFTATQLSSVERQLLIEKLMAVYENEPDAGLHSASEWLLRRWGQGQAPRGHVCEAQERRGALQARTSTDKRQWYVNTQKQTFAILDAGEFLMGSPDSEPDRLPSQESQHRCRIGRRFAISTPKSRRSQFGRVSSGTT